MLQNIYESSPIAVQNLFCTLYGFKEKRMRYSKHFFTYLKFLEESQFWNADEIYNYKLEKLRDIYEFSYEYIPFYRKRYKHHGLSRTSVQELGDLQKIPILSKEDIRSYYTNFKNLNYKGKLVARHTSGTSGKALNFYSSPESIAFQWAVWWRHRNRFGINLGDKHLNFIGKRVVPIRQKHPPYWRVNSALNQHLINMQHIKNENVKFIVEYLNKEKFVFFSGYPSIIYALAELISANDIVLTSPPKIIFTGAEKLYGYQKKLLSEVFQCDIADQYGFSEGAGNASTCQYGLYHEDFEFGHLEYIQPSLNSDQGEILSTGFSNLAMPLIRYQVGDSAIKSDGFCQCGRKSKTFRSFIGRIEDYIITPEGTKIQRFDYLFKETNNIKECQIVQRRLNEITFRIIPRKRYSISEDEDALKKLVKEWISPFIEVYFEYPKEIERSSSGKFVAVKSLIDKQ